ncbi:MAG: sulfatase-like hydrolase/transferase [Acidobacteriaceae bacterium]|nr:sulfatase-like hydrolase/transferase [Acidobacteriaceae bacterium]
MNRRNFIQSLSAAGAAAKLPWNTYGEKHKEPRQIVFILGESTRADMLNCYRQTGLHTPNLDRLAAGGMRFDHAYNVQPVCAPARSTIWTGLYPHTHGVWGNSMPLGDTVHTIGQHLHDRRVDVALIGKWHADGFDYFGTGRVPGGWDPEYWYDMRDYLFELSPEDRIRSRDPKTGDDPTWTSEMCFAHRCTDRALRFLKDHEDQEFMLCVCYDEPHDPSLCPKEYSDAYEDFTFLSSMNVADPLTNKPEEQRIWAGPRLNQQQPPIRDKHFFGSHTYVDTQVGRLLDQIEKIAPNALVIYTSDHGVFLESHRLTDKGPAMYDEITRVPFLVRWPGHTPAGSVNHNLISHIDIAGTFMEFWGFDVPPTMEGTSVLPAFQDTKAPTRNAVFLEWGRYEVDHDGFGGFQPIRCVCNGRYKLSINLMSGDELYDLESDPAEMTNLIDSPQHATLRNMLHDQLLDWMNGSRDPFRGYYWGHRPWRPEFPQKWQNAGMTRQRKYDGYLPKELDYENGLPVKEFTRPKPGPA